MQIRESHPRQLSHSAISRDAVFSSVPRERVWFVKAVGTAQRVDSGCMDVSPEPGRPLFVADNHLLDWPVGAAVPTQWIVAGNGGRAVSHSGRRLMTARDAFEGARLNTSQ